MPGPAATAGTDALCRLVVGLCGSVAALAVMRTLVVGWLLPMRDDLSGSVDVVLVAGLVTTTVALIGCFMAWVARSRRYADATSALRPRWSATLAVYIWLIPVVGLFIGWQVLRDLWAAADPATRDEPGARTPDPLLLIGWLAGIAVSSVIWLAGTVVLGGAPFVDVVAAVALATSAWCLALAVRQITEWQNDGTAGGG